MSNSDKETINSFISNADLSNLIQFMKSKNCLSQTWFTQWCSRLRNFENKMSLGILSNEEVSLNYSTLTSNLLTLIENNIIFEDENFRMKSESQKDKKNEIIHKVEGKNVQVFNEKIDNQTNNFS